MKIFLKNIKIQLMVKKLKDYKMIKKFLCKDKRIF